MFYRSPVVIQVNGLGGWSKVLLTAHGREYRLGRHSNEQDILAGLIC